MDGTYDSNINRSQCRCVDHPSLSIVDDTTICKSSYTSSHQWLFSYMGGYNTFRIVYYFYVCSLPSFALLVTEQFNNSLEAFARMCVNGFLFDPQVNIFGSSSLPLQSEPYAITPGASHPAGPTGTGMTEMARQTSLHRSITQKFRRFQNSVLRPFALATPLAHSTDSGGRRDGYPYEATPVDGGFATSDNGYLNSNFNTSSMTFANFNGQTQSHYTQTHHRDTSIASQLAHRAHATNRQPSEPSYLSRVMRSDVPVAGGNPNHPKGDTLALPFRYSISHLHSKTQRNVPYLRQSWTRIDFLAIVSFWITFALATTGFEHGIGGLHIGVFRAISVIRIARLLSVTSGTTVSFFS